MAEYLASRTAQTTTASTASASGRPSLDQTISAPAAIAQDSTHAESALRQRLRDLGACLVAYSGGVDSTYLLAIAHQELGDRAVAVTADSPSLTRRTLAECKQFCEQHNITHHIVETDEFSDDDYTTNSGLRCYACKAALFRAMHTILTAVNNRAIAPHASSPRPALLLGALIEDFDDYRPGLQAAQEAGARWPLADAGMSKAMVRERSQALNLSTWNRPAEPCLASRVAYGEPVDQTILDMIEQTENILHDAGFIECRARHHRVAAGRAHLCRIEVPDRDIARFVAQRDVLLPRIRRIGYHNVTIDLGGLQSGGFNDVVSAQPSR